MINMGVELFKAGRPHEALRRLEQAVRRAPRAGGLRHHNLGVVLASSADSTRRSSRSNKADTLDAGAMATRRALADTHVQPRDAAARTDGVAATRSITVGRRSATTELMPEAFNGAGMALERGSAGR